MYAENIYHLSPTRELKADPKEDPTNYCKRELLFYHENRIVTKVEKEKLQDYRAQHQTPTIPNSILLIKK